MDCSIKFIADRPVITKSSCICEIENFEKYKDGEKIDSAKVHIPEFDSEWKVEIIPSKGYNTGDSVFQFLISMSPTTVRSSKDLQCRVSGRSTGFLLFESGFLHVTEVDTVISRTVMMQNVKKEGSLRIVFQVELKHTTDPLSFQNRNWSINTKLQLADQYSNLLIEGTYSDFTFIVKDKSFKVHKSILASVSETMRAMFANKYKETTEGVCRVDDIEPNIFENLIQFIYAGIIPANLVDVSFNLYKAAHYYQIIKLLDICKEDIHFRLTVSNALEVFELATMYNIEDMRMDAWKIVKTQCLKIFYPLNNEPLSLEDFQELHCLKMREAEILSKHKKRNVADATSNCKN